MNYIYNIIYFVTASKTITFIKCFIKLLRQIMQHSNFNAILQGTSQSKHKV